MLNNCVNKVLLMGRVITAPRVAMVEDKEMLCFTLVTSEQLRKNGATVEHEESHEIRSCPDLLREAGLLAGDIVFVQGKLHTKKITDERAVKHYRSEIFAYSIERVSVPGCLVH